MDAGSNHDVIGQSGHIIITHDGSQFNPDYYFKINGSSQNIKWYQGTSPTLTEFTSGNMDIIAKNESIVSFYLRAKVKTIINRLINEKAQRPLVADLSDDKLVEFISKHLFERSFFYEQAKYKVNIDAKDVTTITNEVMTTLNTQ